jgi:hypothetical protein
MDYLETTRKLARRALKNWSLRDSNNYFIYGVAVPPAYHCLAAVDTKPPMVLDMINVVATDAMMPGGLQ